MGSIAARDCVRVLELAEQVAAAHLLVTQQALMLRRRTGELPTEALAPHVRAFLETATPWFEFLDEDRRLDRTLEQTTAAVRARTWPLHDSL
jgi:histidine ammonia-lyase